MVVLLLDVVVVEAAAARKGGGESVSRSEAVSFLRPQSIFLRLCVLNISWDPIDARVGDIDDH